MTRTGELGLRERKNLRTRRAIVRAATELTLEGGWAFATIPRISERADVSPRTVSTWFPAKDDIFFEASEELIARATAHLRSTDGGGDDVVDRIAAFIAGEAEGHEHDPEIARLRNEAIRHDPELTALDRRHLEQVRLEIVAAAERDLRAPRGDLRAELFAGAVMAFFEALRVSDPDQVAEIEERLAQGLGVLRVVLAALVGAGGR